MKTLFKLSILTICLAGLLLTGCQNKPADVNKAASEIADFSVPEGYQPEVALELAGYHMVSYHPDDEHSHLYLVQAPADQKISQEKLDDLLSQAKTGQKDRTTRLTVIEKRSATIHGQAVTIVISDGVNGEGNAYRQATVAFDGKGGTALLVLEEPTSQWDDARLDQLVASIQ